MKLLEVPFSGRFSAELVELLVGFLHDFEHIEKGLPFDSEESFELCVTERQGLLYVFGLNEHCRQWGKSAIDGE